MEKCTYCVQRISARADRRPRTRTAPIRDGEIVTACQQACPTQAIVFGDLNDPAQPRSRSCKAQPRNYGLLAELNTRPRTTYLAGAAQPEPRDSSRDGSMAEASTMADAVAPTPTSRPRDAAGRSSPGHTFAIGHRQDQRDRADASSTPRGWLVGFGVALLLVMVLLRRGRLPACPRASASGASTSRSAWGFAIINFVWWIGIGHAGTLISAILLLLRQKWRTSINRFAEAMTLFAVACAGLFPLLHLGRPWFFYWLLPYPEHDGHLAAVPQPAGLGRVRGVDLRHGLAAVLVRGPDPRPGDAARPGAAPASASVVYGMLALGWRGSARHWQRYETAYLLLAGLATPLVRLGPQVVSFDFAVAHRARLALHDLPALLRGRGDLLRLRDGADAGDPAAAVLRPARTSSPCGTSTTWPR